MGRKRLTVDRATESAAAILNEHDITFVLIASCGDEVTILANGSWQDRRSLVKVAHGTRDQWAPVQPGGK